MCPSGYRVRFQVENYNLELTLNSGQAFRWERCGGAWEGVVGCHWVRLSQEANTILAETSAPVQGWSWLAEYLQIDFQLESAIETFPNDKAMHAAISSCPGIRLLKQNPWECLASFILSSNKQIIHIRQIIRSICEKFGDPICGPSASQPYYQFPDAMRLAVAEEADLRECRMGYRARYLKAAAALIASSRIDLSQLSNQPIDEARAALMSIPGIGRKIADCVLLFSLGFYESFPIDVWIRRGLREFYFGKDPVALKELQQFSVDHFGPYAGYAQQYLFHYWRTRWGDARPGKENV